MSTPSAPHNTNHDDDDDASHALLSPTAFVDIGSPTATISAAERASLLPPPPPPKGLGIDASSYNDSSPSCGSRSPSPGGHNVEGTVGSKKENGGAPKRAVPQRQSSLIKPSPGGAKTPRTINRVRFDLSENTGDEEEEMEGENEEGRKAGATHNDIQPNGNGAPYSPRGPDSPLSPRSGGNGRTWVEEEDYLDGEEEDEGPRGPRDRLLEGIEAPSITLAVEGMEDGREGAKSGLRSAFMNMANSIIGAGIIGQPYAFKQAGLFAGIVLLILLTITVDWTIRLIVINSKLSGANSFQATMEHCFGKPGLIAISLAQWAFAFGGMLAFCVIIGDTIPHVLVAVFPSLPDTKLVWLLSDRRFVIVLFVLGISYPLSLYRDIAKLAKASTLALISMLVILVTVITQGARVDSSLKGNLRGSLGINSGVFQAIGVISFAFVCHHNSLLIYGSLKKPTMDRFARVTHYSTTISMLACMTMALAGFLTFGDKTEGNVLNNFPNDNLMVNIARLCFGLNMLTTLPLEAFVCREVLLTYFHPTTSLHPTSSPLVLHVVYTTSLVLVSVLLSLLTCDLGALFELIGATSACALAYIMPPLCYIKLSTRSWRTGVAWAVVAFGVGVMGVSTVMAVRKMVRGGEGKQCM